MYEVGVSRIESSILDDMFWTIQDTPLTGRRLGFRTLEHETASVALPVEGELPAWLCGTLHRVGPAQFEVGTRSYRHWFDGLAMLHRFAFADGAVAYANRFVESRAHTAARREGRIVYSEFATDPCRTLFRRVVTLFSPPRFGDNANVGVDRLGDELVALGETPLPVVFDPGTLETLGVAAPAPGQLTVAHPHRRPLTGERVSYATHFGPVTTYRIYSELEEITRIVVNRPAYMHSFAITERYLVLAEFPFVALPVAIPLSGRPFIENYRWRPRRGTRFRIVELATGKTRVAHGEPFFAFHHVNAFEDGADLVLDVCAYDDAEIVRALYLDRLRGDDPLPAPELRRYRIGTDGSVDRERLVDVGLELPRIDYARDNGRPYRHVYGVGPREPGDFLNQIVKVDVVARTALTWHEEGAFPGEPVFVEGGLLLSVVLDAQSSFLLVLDAGDLHELARARVPHHIPFGFHGRYEAEGD